MDIDAPRHALAAPAGVHAAFAHARAARPTTNGVMHVDAGWRRVRVSSSTSTSSAAGAGAIAAMTSSSPFCSLLARCSRRMVDALALGVAAAAGFVQFGFTIAVANPSNTPVLDAVVAGAREQRCLFALEHWPFRCTSDRRLTWAAFGCALATCVSLFVVCATAAAHRCGRALPFWAFQLALLCARYVQMVNLAVSSAHFSEHVHLNHPLGDDDDDAAWPPPRYSHAELTAIWSGVTLAINVLLVVYMRLLWFYFVGFFASNSALLDTDGSAAADAAARATARNRPAIDRRRHHGVRGRRARNDRERGAHGDDTRHAIDDADDADDDVDNVDNVDTADDVGAAGDVDTADDELSDVQLWQRPASEEQLLVFAAGCVVRWLRVCFASHDAAIGVLPSLFGSRLRVRVAPLGAAISGGGGGGVVVGAACEFEEVTFDRRSWSGELTSVRSLASTVAATVRVPFSYAGGVLQLHVVDCNVVVPLRSLAQLRQSTDVVFYSPPPSPPSTTATVDANNPHRPPHVGALSQSIV